MIKCARETCEKNGSFRCSRCKTMYYCSLDCQKLDWKTHKSACIEFSNVSSFKVVEMHDDVMTTEARRYRRAIKNFMKHYEENEGVRVWLTAMYAQVLFNMKLKHIDVYNKGCFELRFALEDVCNLQNIGLAKAEAYFTHLNEVHDELHTLREMVFGCSKDQFTIQIIVYKNYGEDNMLEYSAPLVATLTYKKEDTKNERDS